MNAEYKQAERVRKRDVIDQPDAIALADAESRRGPLADAVQGQDRRLVERAREKRAGGVALVMIGEDKPRAVRVAQALLRAFARMCSFDLSHAGMARRKLRNPLGAKDRYVSSSRSNLVSGFS